MYYVPGEGDSSDGRTGNWIIQSFKDSKYSMVLPSKDSKKYPFGRFKWEVGNMLFISHHLYQSLKYSR